MEGEIAPMEPPATSVRFQFHATPEELVDLARSWREANGLYLATERLFPDWQAFPFEDDMPREEVDVIGRLGLRREPFDFTPATANEFMRSNDGTLFIHVARLSENVLRESLIGGSTSDRAEAARWRGLIRDVRALSHKGASAQSWAATANLPSHRHTTGAHRLAELSVRMLAFAGSTEYTFDDLRAAPSLKPGDSPGR